MAAWIGAPLLLGALLTGCYALVPLSARMPEPGAHVSATLTDSGALQLAGLLGPRIVAVDGRVLSTSDSALVLAVLGTTNRSHEEVAWRGEPVALPPAVVGKLQTRTFSTARSLLLASAAVLGSVTLWQVIRAGFAGGSSTGGGRPSPN